MKVRKPTIGRTPIVKNINADEWPQIHGGQVTSIYNGYLNAFTGES